MGESLAIILRSIRAASGASLREVERQTGISNAYLSQLENGSTDKPSPHFLHKLATFYKVPYESLMEAAGYLKPPSKVTTNEGKKKRLGALEVALMSARLTEKEQQKVAEFVQFLRSTRRKA
jgi:HTH-type transcriptional regulator, competence development regulator